jgi:hypothetical protein
MTMWYQLPAEIGVVPKMSPAADCIRATPVVEPP